MEPIRVFPNTGHQYFTVPLKKLLPKRDEVWLQSFALANRDVWQKWDDFTRWIRYQYAIEKDPVTDEDVAVMKLVIETNLGLPSRGLLFDVDDKLYSQRPEEETGVPSAYASSDEAQIEDDFGTDRLMPLTYLPNKEGKDVDINLEIHWMRSDGRDPIDVDLIVDLGNSRTIALLLEAPGQHTGGANFGRRVRIVRFIPRATPFDYGMSAGMGSVLDDRCAIIDSWLLLHRPIFAQNDPPFSNEKVSEAWKAFFSPEHNRQMFLRKKYLPHAFVELSPALIGVAFRLRARPRSWPTSRSIATRGSSSVLPNGTCGTNASSALTAARCGSRSPIRPTGSRPISSTTSAASSAISWTRAALTGTSTSLRPRRISGACRSRIRGRRIRAATRFAGLRFRSSRRRTVRSIRLNTAGRRAAKACRAGCETSG